MPVPPGKKLLGASKEFSVNSCRIKSANEFAPTEKSDFTYLFSAFKESRGQALRDPLEHHFVLKISHFLGQAGPGRASPRAKCKALNRYDFTQTGYTHFKLWTQLDFYKKEK